LRLIALEIIFCSSSLSISENDSLVFAGSEVEGRGSGAFLVVVGELAGIGGFIIVGFVFDTSAVSRDAWRNARIKIKQRLLILVIIQVRP